MRKRGELADGLSQRQKYHLNFYFSIISSPVPVGSVVVEASLVEAPLGQRLLLVQDELLEPHLHLRTRHGTYGAKTVKVMLLMTEIWTCFKSLRAFITSWIA